MHVGTKNLRVTGAACLGSFCLGTGKLVMGLWTLSFFTVVSGLYTYGMVAAKLCSLRGMRARPQQQLGYYRWTGIILIAASVLYAVYSTRLLWHPQNRTYSLYAALVIATFTFAEIGLNVYGVIRQRGRHTLLLHAIKMVNLASSLICLVLTQAAILSFTMVDYDASLVNGAIGLLMGAAAAGIGIIMLARCRRLKQQEENQ